MAISAPPSTAGQKGVPQNKAVACYTKSCYTKAMERKNTKETICSTGNTCAYEHDGDTDYCRACGRFVEGDDRTLRVDYGLSRVDDGILQIVPQDNK